MGFLDLKKKANPFLQIMARDDFIYVYSAGDECFVDTHTHAVCMGLRLSCTAT